MAGRSELLEGILVASAVYGYSGASVESALEYSHGSRSAFYRQFANKEECFIAAYGEAADRLLEQVLGAAESAPTWRAGLRAALVALFHFADRHPQVTQALVLQRHAVPQPAQDKYEEVTGRLSRALDRARRETKSRHSSPPWIAEAMVGAIGFTVARSVLKGEIASLRQAIPGLSYLLVLHYFDEEEAAVELTLDWHALGL